MAGNYDSVWADGKMMNYNYMYLELRHESDVARGDRWSGLKQKMSLNAEQKQNKLTEATFKRTNVLNRVKGNRQPLVLQLFLIFQYVNQYIYVKLAYRYFYRKSIEYLMKNSFASLFNSTFWLERLNYTWQCMTFITGKVCNAM